MDKQLPPIDLDTAPDLQQLVDEVVTTRQPVRLQRGGTDVAEIRPARTNGRSRPGWRALTFDDPLFRLVGIGASSAPGDVSAKKHEFIAKGYLERHRR